ncbi:DUF4190 domain-containing protein [Subtercola frigoramans]|uniref:CHASE2 domain-containing sensor protein n=1 Tax=Subtercola frigoramans TaxID=120298 RepID=A0ABS2L4A6_9MICO|nr:DUF4190 domain-containing protein [Subtercola frigoramans]MBM7471902.1 CHASE2 domain-containing sensor protein [Subtercola frigoramans]
MSDDVRPAPAAPVEYSASGRYPVTNTLAIVAFVLVFVVPVAGIVLGYVARSEIRKTKQGGHKLVVAALALGWIFVIFQLMFFATWISLFVQAFAHGR